MIIQKTITGSEPISQEQAKEYLQIDFATDDTLITRLISAARGAVESYCGVSIIDSTVKVEFKDLKDQIKLPYGPVKEVTSLGVNDVDYTDDITEYYQTGYLDVKGAKVEVTYTAGYESIPADLLQTVYDMLKVYYDARGTNVDIPKQVVMILQLHTNNLFL